MSYLANIEGFEGQKIKATVSFWTGAKLFVNGVPAPRGLRRGEMILQRNDGRPVYARWRPQILGLDVPQLIIDGKTINFADPLNWYQWVWSALPILLVFFGGLLGGVAGIIAFSINTGIFRSTMTGNLKYVVTGVVSILAIVIYLVVGTVFYVLLNG